MSENGDVRVWEPDARTEQGLVVASLVVLFVGVVLHTVLWAVSRDADVPAALGLTAALAHLVQLVVGVLVAVLVGIVLVVVHELLHGLVIVLVGGRPTFGAGRSESGAVAFFYTTAPGHLFTREQYALVALAPLVVLGPLLLWWVWAGPWGGWVVLPAAVHLAGCVGDVGLTMLALRQPRGTLVEDRKIGVAFHDPA
ncbi:DUF3267 domain-containing protein [Ornithinimicrobium panacihumi]|uniref:DUF3267 domain-containing protein n=1 Tax=Ornithinimicrobium panacihumi TaxID=2008449 RepID=UPI003F8C41D5